MKKLKRYIIQCVGIILMGVIVAIVLRIRNEEKYYFPLVIILTIIEVIYMYKIYTYSYLPGIKLKTMLDEYRQINDMEVRSQDRENLLQEIKEMLSMCKFRLI